MKRSIIQLDQRFNLKATILGLHLATIPFHRTLSALLFAVFSLLWLTESTFAEKFYLLQKRKLVLLPSLLFSFYAVSLLYSANKDFSFLEKEVLMFFVPIIIASTTLSQKQVIFVLKLFIAGCLFLTLVSIINAIHFYNLPTQHFTVEHLPHQLTSVYHAPFFSLFLVLSNYFVLLIKHKTDKPVGWGWLLIIYFSAFILVLSSRMALVCNILLILVYLFFRISSKNRLKFLVASIAGLFLVLFITLQFYPHFQKRVTAVSEVGNGISERITVYKASAEIISNNFIFGVGVGDLQAEMHKVFDQWNLPAYFYGLNPHNEYLFVWASIGLLGLSLFFFMMLYPLLLSFKKGRYLYAAFYLIFCLSFLTEVVLSRYWGVAAFSFFYSVFTSYLVDNDIPKRKKTDPPLVDQRMKST